MCGEIQSDESKRKELSREFDAIIETCSIKDRVSLCAAIKEKIPYMFDMEKRDYFYSFRNDVAFNRINLAIRNVKTSPVQENLI